MTSAAAASGARTKIARSTARGTSIASRLARGVAGAVASTGTIGTGTGTGTGIAVVDAKPELERGAKTKSHGEVRGRAT